MLKTVTKNTFFLQFLYIIYYYKILSLLFLYFIQMLNKRQKAMITQRQRHYSMTKQKRQKQYFIKMLKLAKQNKNLLKNINILI